MTTPRALRRRTLAVLLAWLIVAIAHHDGVFGDDAPASRLPVDVGSAATLR